MSPDPDIDVCLSCNESLPRDGLYMTCVECSYKYHLGSCSGLTEKPKGTKKTWKCATCKSGRLRSGQGTSRQSQERDIGVELIEINRKLTELLTVKEKVDALASLKDKIDAIEHSVKHMSDSYDEVLEKVRRQESDIANLRQRLEKLESQHKDDVIGKLEQELNNLEQHGRRQNLEIHGLAPTAQENLFDKVNEIALKLELPQLSPADIDAVHRLPSRPDRAPVVLLRFSSRLTRDSWFEKRRQLRPVGLDVYFHENLTARNKRLLWLVRQKAQEKGYQFSWHKNGKTFVRRAAGDPAIKIECETDLSKIR